MNIIFFVVGSIIFGIYVWIALWIILNDNNTKKKDNDYDQTLVDIIDMDGHGNYGRFPQKNKTMKL